MGMLRLNALHTTKYIKLLADSANFKVATFNKNCNVLQVCTPKCQTFNIRSR